MNVSPNRQVLGRRRGSSSPLVALLVALTRNSTFLLGLCALVVLVLLMRDPNAASDYYDLGTSALPNLRLSQQPCPELPPVAKAATTRTTVVAEPNGPDVHKTATVMAMATGYKLVDYQRYVGSLRKTGYEGNIILVVHPEIGEIEEKYLQSKNVIMHKVKYTPCSHPSVKDKDPTKMKNSHEREVFTCVDPYPKLKHRWARFPLLRDLLQSCGGQENPEVTCGGPVLISDMRDTIFQRNPFGPEAPKVYGLQVFEEHFTIRTTHWLVNWPVGDCKGVHYDEPMLCSGTTIGTRKAMLEYLDIFHKEMDVWMESPKCCCFNINGDDQSMHNYLYYSGMLNNVTGGVYAAKNRDGLVHTVGAMGSLIGNTHTRNTKALMEARGQTNRLGDAHWQPFEDSTEDVDNGFNKTSWLGSHYGMTDREGYFVDFDGSRSFIVHQYDRFGIQYGRFLDRNRDKLYYP